MCEATGGGGGGARQQQELPKTHSCNLEPKEAPNRPVPKTLHSDPQVKEAPVDRLYGDGPPAEWVCKPVLFALVRVGVCRGAGEQAGV